jgi:hypothetical protein
VGRPAKPLGANDGLEGRRTYALPLANLRFRLANRFGARLRIDGQSLAQTCRFWDKHRRPFPLVIFSLTPIR